MLSSLFALPGVAAETAAMVLGAGSYRVMDLLPGWRPKKDMPDLTGKVAIVTGPTLNGMGHVYAVELARKGAHVILAGRNASKGEEALGVLKREISNAKAEFMFLDLGSLSSVKSFADAFIAKKLPLHILLNNAGVMFNPFSLTADGFESQFGTNYLGHYLLTRLLTPVLEKSAPARVVHIASVATYWPDYFLNLSKVVPARFLPQGADKKVDFSNYLRADYEPFYDPYMAYGRSKLATLLFARALDRRVHSKKIYSNAAHPGGVRSNLLRHIENNIKRNFGDIVSFLAHGVVVASLLTPSEGVVTGLYLATAPEIETKDIHGKIYQPQAREAPLPASDTEELEEHLWNLSEELVKDYL